MKPETVGELVNSLVWLSAARARPKSMSFAPDLASMTFQAWVAA